MSFLKSTFLKLQSYVADFEQSIDNDFAQRNQMQVNPEPAEKSTIGLDQTDDSEQSNDAENSNPIKENTSEPSKLSNQTQEDTKTENTQLNEEETKQKIDDLKNQISGLESELENQNKLLTKYTTLKNEMGSNGYSVIKEFQNRNSKIQNQIQELNEIESKIQNEIDTLQLEIQQLNGTSKESAPSQNSDHNNADIQSNLQNDFANIQQKHLAVYEEYQKVIANSKTLLDDDQQLSIKIDQAIDLITNSQKKLKELQIEKDTIENESNHIQSQINQAKKANEILAEENSKAENELQTIRQEVLKFNQSVESMQNEILEKKEKLKQIEADNQIAIEKKRRGKIDAMKNLAQTVLDKIDKERIDILTQLNELSMNDTKTLESEELARNDIAIMINQSEIDAKILEKKFEETKNSIPNQTRPLENQIEMIKTVYANNEKVEKSVIQRLRNQLSVIELKQEDANLSIKKLNEQIDKATAEKLSLTSDQIVNEIHDISIQIEKMNSSISQLKETSFDLTGQIHQLKADISIKKSKLSQIETTKRSLETQYLSQLRELQEQTKVESVDKQTEYRTDSTTSLFRCWKDLALECGRIDAEIEKMQKVIESEKDIEKVFHHALSVVSDRQESVDQVKRIINRERDFFHKRILEIIDGS